MKYRLICFLFFSILWLLSAVGKCVTPPIIDPGQHILKIYVFLSPDCPISQRMVPTLSAIYTEYKDQVTLVGIVPFGVNDTTLRDFKKEYNIPFSLTIDSGCRLSALYNIKTVPSAIVLTQSDKIIYKGAIDNSFRAVGNTEYGKTKEYLRNAIKEALLLQSITLSHTEPVGCLIHCDL